VDIPNSFLVVPGLVSGIPVLAPDTQSQTRMAGTSPAMTKNDSFSDG
jgi:hypothetical protein